MGKVEGELYKEGFRSGCFGGGPDGRSIEAREGETLGERIDFVGTGSTGDLKGLAS